MADTLKLTILSPERRLLEGVAVRVVTLPGAEGQIQILSGHAPMVGSLDTGVFSFETASPGPNAVRRGIISTGFFKVVDDHLTVVAETLELEGEVDLDRAKRALAKAEEALKDPALDEHQFKKYQLKMQRALIRQQLSNHPNL